MPLSDS